MAITGFGATLVGSTTGAISDLKEVTVGGYTIAVISHNTLGSANRLGSNKRGGVTRGNIVATVEFDKTVYASLELAALTEANESWTLTDQEGNTWVGDGFLNDLGEVGNAQDSENTHTLEITPATDWAYTAVS